MTVIWHFLKVVIVIRRLNILIFCERHNFVTVIWPSFMFVIVICNFFNFQIETKIDVAKSVFD